MFEIADARLGIAETPNAADRGGVHDIDFAGWRLAHCASYRRKDLSKPGNIICALDGHLSTVPKAYCDTCTLWRYK